MQLIKLPLELPYDNVILNIIECSLRITAHKVTYAGSDSTEVLCAYKLQKRVPSVLSLISELWENRKRC